MAKTKLAKLRYDEALKFLEERTSVVIPDKYSIYFSVDSEGYLEYYPKSDRLHKHGSNDWFDNGLVKLKEYFKKWEPEVWAR